MVANQELVIYDPITGNKKAYRLFKSGLVQTGNGGRPVHKYREYWVRRVPTRPDRVPPSYV